MFCVDFALHLQLFRFDVRVCSCFALRPSGGVVLLRIVPVEFRHDFEPIAGFASISVLR